jgi:hypothetical protein
MSAVSGVNGSQNQQFVELVNKPQGSYQNNSQPVAMQSQPEMDSYEGPKEEKKKGSILGKILTTLVVAGALVGLNRFAHHKEWIKPATEGSKEFADKFIKKPLNELDKFVLENWNKITKKGAKATGDAAE